MKLKRRHVLSKKELKRISSIILNSWGVNILEYDAKWEVGDLGNFSIILANGVPMIIIVDDEDFGELMLPTIVFFAKHKPYKKFIKVDSGAVPHIANGADVMRPGIVDCDLDIRKGDIVYITGEGISVPIGVGIALMNGEEMLNKEKGRAVKIIHYISDEIMVIAKRAIESLRQKK